MRRCEIIDCENIKVREWGVVKEEGCCFPELSKYSCCSTDHTHNRTTRHFQQTEQAQIQKKKKQIHEPHASLTEKTDINKCLYLTFSHHLMIIAGKY